MIRLIYLLIVIAFLACKGNENKEASTTGDTLVSDSVHTEYTCPMHPEIVSDTPGICPRCRMELNPKT